jgi:hypothetical protein
MPSRYWCRIVSVDCFHDVLRDSVIDWFGTYLLILYGPSERVFCRKVGSSGM